MKSLSALCVLVLIFGIVLEKSEAKLICRCDNNKGITDIITTGKATNSCGETGKLYCYVYAANPYCEVGNEAGKVAFSACCNTYGEDVSGTHCEEIS